ncbi:ATP-binding protein [Azospirillum picis]|uniref:histidine kinase n=1 Tax=Azospirillum picis TaxID=488438 RepID=A0ABU0MH24_9PROT|nr:ATP-binding protein [Azospirillum picis]MBP2299022.1 light-regulated signal transduction histidine kinase (bacteriophytochrome) [Azospirillum picis]MDQ0532736.1 light-regulated signal transduction histidine kinase (bacteriophytochrome) [Azospirillum picis]
MTSATGSQPWPDNGAGTLDLDACAREPIHVPGSIQPHGHLLAIEQGTLRIVRASAHAGAVLNRPLEDAFGQPIDRLLDADDLARLVAGLRNAPAEPVQLDILHLRSGSDHQAIAHRSGDLVILELEELAAAGVGTLEALYPQMREAIRRMQAAPSFDALLASTAQEVRALTGFDRVLVYRFDEEWNGTVIAEDGNGRLPSYRGLRFPASDVPQQARRLYALSRLRLIPDARYRPVPILAREAEAPPLDLSFSVLRSVSPVHLEYMRNMDTPASMSISVMDGDRLWGLISCHHAEPRQVSFAVRTACDLLGQVLSSQMIALERAEEADHRIRSKSIQARLLAHMAASERFVDGLAADPDDLLTLVNAEGAAILFDGHCRLIGHTPPQEAVEAIAHELAGQGIRDLFASHHLPADMQSAAGMEDSASGLLAISISQLHPSYLMWFRPEIVQTIDWAGDPNKPMDPTGRLSPRNSFESWKETVRGQSLPWRHGEVEAAGDFRNAIVSIVLRKAEEMAALNDELRRSNSELAAFSYSVSHDLRAPFRHVSSYAELLRSRAAGKLSDRELHYLNSIIEAAGAAGTLVDGLLHFSQLGRATLARKEVDVERLVAEVQHLLLPELQGRSIHWTVHPLPCVNGDPTMLRLVVQNLLSNAIKYTRERADTEIEIGCHTTADAHEFYVKDNGRGFDPAYSGKLFGVFQRLHREEEFEGIGIGLANVRRIVERHGGHVWAEGKLDCGATFHFSLPRSAAADPR